MSLKIIKKQMKELDKQYRNITNTPFGSLLVSVAIMNPELQMNKYAFLKRFKQCEFISFGSDFSVAFNINVFYGKGAYNKYVKEKSYLALVESNWNSLYMPFVTDNSGEKLILPLEKDGSYPNTLKYAKSIKYQGNKDDSKYF